MNSLKLASSTPLTPSIPMLWATCTRAFHHFGSNTFKAPRTLPSTADHKEPAGVDFTSFVPSTINSISSKNSSSSASSSTHSSSCIHPTYGVTSYSAYNAPNLDPKDSLIIYGTTPCPFVERVVMALKHANKAFQYKDIDLGSLKDRQGLKLISPVQKVPVLVHGTKGAGSEKILFESASIVQYIDDCFSGTDENRLMRGTPYEKSLARSWTHFINNKIAPQMWDTLFAADANVFDKNYNALIESFDYLEKALPLISSGPYFLGTKMSFVDVMIAPFLHRRVLISHFKGKELFPVQATRLKALQNALEDNKIYRETVATGDTLVSVYGKFVTGGLHPKFSWH